MPCVVVCGAQYGDEGKGKVVAYLSSRDRPAYVIRGGVGPNAGHGVRLRGKEFECRHVPSGFVCETAQLRVGAGTLVDPRLFIEEMEALERLGTTVRHRMGLDGNCGVIEQRHVDEERGSDFYRKEIGSMLSGCGRAASERALRKLKTAREIEELSQFIRDVASEANDALDNETLIILEGSQGFGLSLYHGQYPFVTSKDTSASSVASDVGVSPKMVEQVFLVVKPYVTRAGMGPLKAEGVPQVVEEEIRPGVAIGKHRRVAGFDWELIRRAVMINRPTCLALTNVDRMWEENRGVKQFDELCKEAKRFVTELEDKTKVPVGIISTGPEVEDAVDRRE